MFSIFRIISIASSFDFTFSVELNFLIFNLSLFDIFKDMFLPWYFYYKLPFAWCVLEKLINFARLFVFCYVYRFNFFFLCKASADAFVQIVACNFHIVLILYSKQVTILSRDN